MTCGLCNVGGEKGWRHRMECSSLLCAVQCGKCAFYSALAQPGYSLVWWQKRRGGQALLLSRWEDFYNHLPIWHKISRTRDTLTLSTSADNSISTKKINFIPFIFIKFNFFFWGGGVGLHIVEYLYIFISLSFKLFLFRFFKTKVKNLNLHTILGSLQLHLKQF